MDMKDSQDVKKELEKLPFEIVYVCTDSQYEAWMEKIVGSEIEGYHLFLNEKLSAQVTEHFRISHHPSFLFIDQEGNCDPDLIKFLAGLNVETIKSKLKE